MSVGSLTDGFYVMIQKSVRPLLFARPTHRGPGIAHCSRTSKRAEPHADMVYHNCTHDTLVSCATCKYTIHKASTVCVILGYNLKFSRFLCVKKERRVNAFQKICRWQGCCCLPLSLSLPASPLTVAWLLRAPPFLPWGSLREMVCNCKFKTYSFNSKNLCCKT